MGVFSKTENDAKGLNDGRLSGGRTETASTKPPETLSTLGHRVLVTGNIVSEGTLQIFGRVNGDIQASHLIVKEGAQIEGNIVAQEAVILGTCKGMIHGNTVKLQGTAVVEGEIYSKSLAIEQEALFEGVSRRLERAVEAPSVAPAPLPAKIATAPETAPAAPEAATAAAAEPVNA